MSWRIQTPRPTNRAILAAKLGYRSILWRERLLGRLAIVAPAEPHHGIVVNWLAASPPPPA